MEKYFTDTDLLQEPTETQKAVVANHEEICEFYDIKYLKDGETVLFNIGDNDWVSVRNQKA